MEREKQVGILPNGDGAIIVTEGQWRGHPVVDIRKFYRDMNEVDIQAYAQKVANNEIVTDGLKHTKKGIMISREQFMGLMQEHLIPLYEAYQGKG